MKRGRKPKNYIPESNQVENKTTETQGSEIIEPVADVVNKISTANVTETNEQYASVIAEHNPTTTTNPMLLPNVMTINNPTFFVGKKVVTESKEVKPDATNFPFITVENADMFMPEAYDDIPDEYVVKGRHFQYFQYWGSSHWERYGCTLPEDRITIRVLIGVKYANLVKSIDKIKTAPKGVFEDIFEVADTLGEYNGEAFITLTAKRHCTINQGDAVAHIRLKHQCKGH